MDVILDYANGKKILPIIRRTSANVMLLSSFHVPVCRLDYQGHGGYFGFMHISLFSQTHVKLWPKQYTLFIFL